MHRNLTEILSDIEAASEIANRDLFDISPRLHAGHQMAVREAKERVGTLTNEYAQALLSNTAGLFTAGDPVKCAEFAKLAAEECGTLTVDVGEMYLEIARAIEPTLGQRREFSFTQLEIVMRSLFDVANRLKLKGSMAVPRLPESLVVETLADVAECVKKLVTEANGHALMVEYSKNAMVERGLAAKFDGKVTRVVILNVGEAEANALKDSFRSRRIVTITPETVVDASFAIATVEGQKASTKAAKASKTSDAQSATDGVQTTETKKESK